ncbi:coiled-coil domain-containing protein 124 [Scaptodrosophila lebanonensis]|uniref:Coiled-coil domain-containing protein 124 n=1 Tax=Drosophila lebanonensis TaxID=7225 RepID=A0A6J2T679_DROLE|nr:coiled-coil domain-containing protein 124 [Scaptodrosophila lebanonensis]
MPKKMGLNSKAVEARERKDAIKKAAQERVAKEAEDVKWLDDDKKNLAKQRRRENDELKRAEAARRKAEAKVLLDQEMSSIRTQGKQPLAKINRQQILEELDKKQRVIEAINSANKPAARTVVQQNVVIEENLNRAMADTCLATNVDQALAVLSINDEEDKHPEKRMRAAYKSFEAANLPRIKAENPQLRMSQWKQLLMKEWNKSPDNPFNQGR